MAAYFQVPLLISAARGSDSDRGASTSPYRINSYGPITVLGYHRRIAFYEAVVFVPCKKEEDMLSSFLSVNLQYD